MSEQKRVNWREFIQLPENERKAEDVESAWADFMAEKLAEKDRAKHEQTKQSQ